VDVWQEPVKFEH